MTQWKSLSPSAQEDFIHYETLRHLYISEGHFLNQFLWADYYKTRYTTDEKALFLSMQLHSGGHGFFAPLCRESDLSEAFLCMEQMSEELFHEPLRIYLADKRMTDILSRDGCLKNYTVSPDRDCFDYLYEAERLRTLTGKSMHKKKNLLNGFLRRYEGRFSYHTLGVDDIPEIMEFDKKWRSTRPIKDKYQSIRDEEEGILRLFENSPQIACHMGGVRIDGELQAYSIGSYVSDLHMAIIHIEKADPLFHGLYNYINREFIVHEFPQATLINREDDLGQENLRQAKESYRPVRLEEKYSILPK